MACVKPLPAAAASIAKTYDGPYATTEVSKLRRLFWLGIGVAVGVLVVRKLTQTTQKFTPSGLASTAGATARGVAGKARGFIADVRAGAAQREDELVAALEEEERNRPHRR